MAALTGCDEQLLFLADEEGDVEDEEMLGGFFIFYRRLEPNTSPQLFAV